MTTLRRWAFKMRPQHPLGQAPGTLQILQITLQAVSAFAIAGGRDAGIVARRLYTLMQRYGLTTARR